MSTLNGEFGPGRAVIQRRPQASVVFMGETSIVVPTEYLLAVSTDKALNVPSGTFEVVVKSVASPERGKDSTNGGPWQRSAKAPQGDYWLENIRPMMMVQIAFGDPDTLRGLANVQSSAFKTDTVAGAGVVIPGVLVSDDVLERHIVMMGLVDTVMYESTMTPSGVQSFVRIMGRDLSKIFTDDTSHMSVVNMAEPGSYEPGGIIALGTQTGDARSPGFTPEQQKDLENRVTTASKNPMWELYGMNGDNKFTTMNQAFQLLVGALPSYQVVLQNKKKIRDYFLDTKVDEEFKDYSLATYLYFSFSGPVWQLMNEFAPAPCAELFCDTIGQKAQVIVRRAPLFRSSQMKGFSTVLTSSAIKVTKHPALNRFDELDDMLTVPLRLQRVLNYPANQQYHTVHDNEIIASNLARSDASMVTEFQAIPQFFLSGEPTDPGVRMISPVLIDTPGSVRYGLRMMQATVPWWTEHEDKKTDDEGNDIVTYYHPSLEDVGKFETVRMYYLFRDNAEYLSGTIVIRGREEIRIGDRVLLPDAGNMLFYVEKVSHSFQIGAPFTSTVLLTRGHPKDYVGRLAPYDLDPPVGPG